MASGLLFMASGLQNSLHWLLAGTVLGSNRTWLKLVAGTVLGRNLTWLKLVAGTVLGRNVTWLMLVAGTVLGRNMTWLMLVAGTIHCWWKATELGSSKEPFLFFFEIYSFSVLKFTIFHNKSIIRFVPVNLSASEFHNQRFNVQINVKINAELTCQNHNNVKINAQSTCQNHNNVKINAQSTCENQKSNPN